MNKFCFKLNNYQLLEYGKYISEGFYSIHIRRGDYLEKSELYGGICTRKYYTDAIEYIKYRDKNAKFIVFSDETDRNKLSLLLGKDNIIYFQQEDFTEYEDWYDMYLMSICKHNIIANSTFSWWGAWLNRNDNKIVVAPQKWINIYKYEDIYPKEWVQI